MYGLAASAIHSCTVAHPTPKASAAAATLFHAVPECKSTTSTTASPTSPTSSTSSNAICNMAFKKTH